MASVDSNRSDTYHLRHQQRFSISSEETVPKNDGPDGDTETESEKLEDLFVGDKLVTRTERNLGVSKGNRDARRQIYENIDSLFYENNSLNEEVFNALKLLDRSEFNIINSLYREADLDAGGLVEVYEDLDGRGFVDYEGPEIELTVVGEYALEFIHEHESY